VKATLAGVLAVNRDWLWALPKGLLISFCWSSLLISLETGLRGPLPERGSGSHGGPAGKKWLGPDRHTLKSTPRSYEFLSVAR
jgi:hypothetical protein